MENAAVNEVLAKKLHGIMERFDPSPEERWDDLDAYRKEFFCHVVKAFTGEAELRKLLGLVP